MALGKEQATRREKESFITLDAKGVYMTGIKKAEDAEELIIRLVEVEGNAGNITLRLPKDIRRLETKSD